MKVVGAQPRQKILLTGEVSCKDSIKLAGQKGLTAVRHDWITVSV